MISRSSVHNILERGLPSLQHICSVNSVREVVSATTATFLLIYVSILSLENIDQWFIGSS